MFPLLMPALIGAGIGGGVNLLRGKDPLKGALLGGATGAVTGGVGNYFNTGSLLGASEVGKQVAQNAMIGAPQAMGNFVTDPLTGTILNMDYYSNALGTPIFTGGQGLLSNAYDMASTALPEALKNELTPQNMVGVANILSQQTQAPRISGSGGGGLRGGGPVQYQPISTVAIPTRTRRTLIG
jgi:hypothetical protein